MNLTEYKHIPYLSFDFSLSCLLKVKLLLAANFTLNDYFIN